MGGISLATKGVIVPETGKDISIEKGIVEIEPDRWQLITIPVQFGYFDTTSGGLVHDWTTVARIKEYVCDQIEYKLGGSASNYIKIANCYIGDEDMFRNFVPGVTNPSSSQNFPLAVMDGANLEYTAFWIRSIYPSSIQVEWGE